MVKKKSEDKNEGVVLKIKTKPERKVPVRVELPAFLKTVEIPKSTVQYLIQHYGGKLKFMKEWQAVIDGIRNNPVS